MILQSAGSLFAKLLRAVAILAGISFAAGVGATLARAGWRWLGRQDTLLEILGGLLLLAIYVMVYIVIPLALLWLVVRVIASAWRSGSKR